MVMHRKLLAVAHRTSVRLILVTILLLGTITPILVSKSTAYAMPQAMPHARGYYCIFCLGGVDVNMSLGDLVGAVKALEKLIDDELPKLSAEVKSNVLYMRQQLDGLLRDVSTTFLQDTKIVLTEINQEMQLIFNRVQGLLKDSFTYISILIDQGEHAVKDIIKLAADEVHSLINQFEQAATRIIILATGNIIMIIDRTFYDAFGLASFIIFDIVLVLVLVNLFALWRGGVSSGAGRRGPLLIGTAVTLAVILLLTGSVWLVPSARAAAVSGVSPGKQRQVPTISKLPSPEIFSTSPTKITTGKDKQLRIIGYNLRLEGYGEPTVEIGGQGVPVTSASVGEVDADITTLNLTEGPKGVIVTYQPITGTNVISADVSVFINPQAPPPKADLEITNFTISPANPVLNEAAQATITVHNKGQGPASSFIVQWKLDASSPTGETQNFDGLLPSQVVTATLTSSYLQAGNVQSVAQIDPFGQIEEVDKSNNTVILNVLVGAPTPGPGTGNPKDPVKEPSPRPTKRPHPPLYKCETIPQLAGCDFDGD